MNFEKAQEFASKRKELDREIESNQPGETGLEGLSAEERFDLLWDRIGELAEIAPQGGTYRISQDAVRAKAGDLTVVVRRTTDEYIPGSLRPERKSLEADWYIHDQHLGSEKISNIAIAFDRDDEQTSARLGLLEESVAEAEKMTHELVGRIASFDAVHHGIPGHP